MGRDRNTQGMARRSLNLDQPAGTSAGGGDARERIAVQIDPEQRRRIQVIEATQNRFRGQRHRGRLLMHLGVDQRVGDLRQR